MSAVLVDLEQLAKLLAERVVELLIERDHARPAGLVDAAELARILGVSRSTIYDRAADLGAVQLGDGSRPRLRFDVETACAAWTRRTASERSQAPEPPAPTTVRRARRPPKSGSGARLLPVKGQGQGQEAA